jgi:hypothetical protein
MRCAKKIHTSDKEVQKDFIYLFKEVESKQI